MRRRILYILGSSPMKAHSGVVRHRQFLDRLSERHEVRVVVVGSAGEPQPSGTAGGGWIDAVDHVAVRARPGLTGFDVRQARRRIEPLIDRWGPDVIVADKHGALAVPVSSDVPIIVDFCDAKSAHHLRRLRVERTPVALARLARAVLLEQSAARRAAIAIFVSERDRSDTRFVRSPPRTEVVSNGVDVAYWAPSPAGRDRPTEPTGPTLILTGRMDYPPNVDGAVQLCRTVLPRVAERVPEVRAVVAGADPTPEVRALAAESRNVEVTGTVDDLRPHLADAALFVAPLRFGAGVQNKVLEALAMGLPVVTTPLVAAGLPAVDGAGPPVDVCAIDEMAMAVTELLLHADPASLADRSRSGREWVTRHCSWDAAADRLHALIEELAQ